MVAKRNSFKEQGKDLLQTLAKKLLTKYMKVISDGMLTTDSVALQIFGVKRNMMIELRKRGF